MEFGFTPAQERFQMELRALLTSAPVQCILADLRQLPPRADRHVPELHRLLADHGLLAIHWPSVYGGGGLSEIEAGIFVEEASRAGVPMLVYSLTISIFGAFMLLAGTEAQKCWLLPPIARGELICNILYTEPDAGSDLAALRTRAVPDGDGFCINGVKIFNSVGHLAQYGLIAARTDLDAPRHKGITLFLVPMQDPRVRVRPIWTMADEHFNEVVINDVWVPRTHMVGELNDGWGLLNQALAVERNGLGIAADAQRWLDLLVSHVRETGQGQDPIVRQRIAHLAADVEAARLLAWRVVSSQARREVNDIGAAMSKWYAGELCRRLTHVAGEIMGIAGTLSRFDAEAPVNGELEAAHRWAPAWGIAAGTSEIMLYLIANRALSAGK